MEVKVRNNSEAFCELLRRIDTNSVKRESRAGYTLEIPEPVFIRYERPRERLIFFEDRDFPTIFTLMESIWMLAGRNDVEWLAQFNSRMREFSDDGKFFHGAYGFRWRQHFYRDQLIDLVELLKNKPDTRRAVLAMWDGRIDLNIDESGKDMPCNMLIKFQRRQDRLDMTVYNRSNDLIWGTCGANAVHFSMLHEYIAAGVGMEMGHYWQISDNLHVYGDVYEKYKHLQDFAPDPFRSRSLCDYGLKIVKPIKLVNNPETFLQECEWFCNGDLDYSKYENEFFRDVMNRVRDVYFSWKNKENPNRFNEAKQFIEYMPDCDWKRSIWQWLDRRQRKVEENAC